MTEKREPRGLPVGGSQGSAGQGSWDDNNQPNSPPGEEARRTAAAPPPHGGPTPIYRAIIGECERRRLALGIPMAEFSEIAGLPDRYYPKALSCDEPSGRQAAWPTLQVIIDALFPDGCDVQIRPRAGAALERFALKLALRFDKKLSDGRTRRSLLRQWGRLGGLKHRRETLVKIGKRGARARNRRLPKAKRSELARRAARALWARKKTLPLPTPEGSR